MEDKIYCYIPHTKEELNAILTTLIYSSVQKASEILMDDLEKVEIKNQELARENMKLKVTITSLRKQLVKEQGGVEMGEVANNIYREMAIRKTKMYNEQEKEIAKMFKKIAKLEKENEILRNELYEKRNNNG